MNFTLFWRIIAPVMSGKYSQSASWTREIWALAVFVAGFTLHDWQSQGSERLLALMMMLGSGAFMCFALVERLFFLPPHPPEGKRRQFPRIDGDRADRAE